MKISARGFASILLVLPVVVVLGAIAYVYFDSHSSLFTSTTATTSTPSTSIMLPPPVPTASLNHGSSPATQPQSADIFEPAQTEPISSSSPTCPIPQITLIPKAATLVAAGGGANGWDSYSSIDSGKTVTLFEIADTHNSATYTEQDMGGDGSVLPLYNFPVVDNSYVTTGLKVGWGAWGFRITAKTPCGSTAIKDISIQVGKGPNSLPPMGGN